MYKIEIPNRERKVINKLPAPLRNDIENAIKALAKDPRPIGCLKLTNAKEVWRVRVQHHRIGYRIDDIAKVVTVIMVSHRNEFYPKGASK